MSKVKEKQNIPQGWKEKKLSELLVEVNERNRDRAELPVLSVTNSRGFVLQSEQFARNLHSKNTSNYKIVSKEQFAYNPARINVGSIALLRKWEKGLLSPMYVVFGTKDELLNDYLHYYIQSPRFGVQVSNNTAGSVRKSLNFNAFEHFEYVYPESKQEQKKIVEVLASVDEEMQKTKEVIKATEKLKKGLMQKLFTQGIGHTKFKQTELGEIPESWEVKTIRNSSIDLVDGDRGLNYPKQKDFLEEGHCLFLSAKNVTRGGFSFYETSFITREKDEVLRKGKLERGDVVLTSRGTVGNVAIYDDSVPFGHVRINSGMLIFRHGNEFLPDFLYWYLTSSQMQRAFQKMGSGSAQPQLPIRSLELIHVPIVPKKEQEKISTIISSVHEKVLVNKKILAKQTEIKKGLMQDLLSGVKRVNV